ncbi:hypothetical protein XccvBFoX4_gp62c [Xanthomonas phage FoX4]|uniref:DNMP kinase n=1 Tax=Xanthomonas phage FoX4 TaxID=2723900 RepID=A0A858XBH4_9CAUD|nr:hypothetical protein KNU97_gp62 [Xanthomonas phage FoX4]QJI53016.1 hypothetical protein XccvBFoX4_gp62c [Xanthomonas phage FoX4]
MSELIIIGLTGLPGSGKDTIADALVAQLGFTKMSFAEALYIEVAEAFGISTDLLQQRSTKESDFGYLHFDASNDREFVRCMIDAGHDPLQSRSPRRLLQQWGTEYRRAQNPTYWIEKVSAKVVAASIRGERRFVYTDVRFNDEAEWLQDWHGSTGISVEIWQVARDNCKRSAHASDKGLHPSHIDMTFYNASTVGALQSAALVSARRVIEHGSMRQLKRLSEK